MKEQTKAILTSEYRQSLRARPMSSKHVEIVEPDAGYLELVREDISGVVAWAQETDELIPTDIAIDNAYRVIERVFWAWPQRFDVYPLDGTVAIDSEAVDQAFVMILCKSDGSISAMGDLTGKSQRKDYDGRDQPGFDALVSTICNWLIILRQKRGTVETLEYNNGRFRTRISWEGDIVVILAERREAIPTEQSLAQSIQSTLPFTNIGRQDLLRPKPRSSCPNCNETRRGSRGDVLWMGFDLGECNHQQWAQDYSRPGVRQSIPRSYSTSALSGQRGIRTAFETDDAGRILDSKPPSGTTTVTL